MAWFTHVRRPGNKVERILIPFDPVAARKLAERLWAKET